MSRPPFFLFYLFKCKSDLVKSYFLSFKYAWRIEITWKKMHLSQANYVPHRRYFFSSSRILFFLIHFTPIFFFLSECKNSSLRIDLGNYRKKMRMKKKIMCVIQKCSNNQISTTTHECIVSLESVVKWRKTYGFIDNNWHYLHTHIAYLNSRIDFIINKQHAHMTFISTVHLFL